MGDGRRCDRVNSVETLVPRTAKSHETVATAEALLKIVPVGRTQQSEGALLQLDNLCPVCMNERLTKTRAKFLTGPMSGPIIVAVGEGRMRWSWFLIMGVVIG